MDIPKITIVVPVYNTEKYLPCCMDSLLNQTLKEIEIILVDDGSTDNCPGMCDDYAKQDPRVKVIHKKNEGFGLARNSGIEIAAGEYITTVDSDDYVELNAYKKLYSIIENTKTDWLYSTVCQRFNDRGDTWSMGRSKEKHYHTKKDIRELILDLIANPPKSKDEMNMIVSVWNALYRLDIIKKYNLKFISERVSHFEDLRFNVDYLLHVSNAIAISYVFYNYRFSISSFTRTPRLNKINHSHLIYQYLLEKLTTNNFGKEGYLRATRLFLGDSRGGIRDFICSSLTKKEKIQWLKKVANHPIWREIAFSYPYKELPWKQELQFYLLYKGYCHLLYYLVVIRSCIYKTHYR